MNTYVVLTACISFACVCEKVCVFVGGWEVGEQVGMCECKYAWCMYSFWTNIYMLSYLLHHQIHNYPQKSQECHELLTAEPGLGYLRHLTPWKIFLITLHLYQAWLKTSPSSPFLALMPFLHVTNCHSFPSDMPPFQSTLFGFAQATISLNVCYNGWIWHI